MSNRFDFKQFSIWQEHAAMKVTTDGVILGAWVVPPAEGKILDVGAGTGLLSLMLAQRSRAEIIALEPDRLSYMDLNGNIQHSPWKNRITALDLSLERLDRDPAYNHYFNFIVSNPPYHTGFLPDNGPKQTARHTVTLSHPSLLKYVSGVLHENGCFAVILPESVSETFLYLASQHHLYCNRWTDVIPDTGKPVLRRMMAFEKEKKTLLRSSIIIRDGKKFSSEYIDLTKDFYIRFSTEEL